MNTRMNVFFIPGESCLVGKEHDVPGAREAAHRMGEAGRSQGKIRHVGEFGAWGCFRDVSILNPTCLEQFLNHFLEKEKGRSLS